MRCRLCHSTDTALIGDFSVAEIENYPLSGMVEIWRCRACGLVLNRIAQRNDYAAYYLRFNKHHARNADARPLDRAYFESCLEQLDLADCNASILDYGSGDRLFTEICAARNLGSVSSYDVHMDFPQRRYDVVVTTHTFEHVVDIRADFARMASLVADGGKLLFAVPDADAYLQEYCGPFGWLDLEHINHFTLPSVAALFGLAGLEILSVRRGGREVRPGLIYPEIRVVGKPKLRQASADPLGSYLEHSARDLARLSTEFDRFLSDPSYSNIFLWGCGITARRLLNRANHPRLRVCDIDSRLQGMRIGAYAIEPPEVVPNAPDTGIFVAAVNQDAIAAAIAAALPQVRIVTVDFDAP